MALPAPIELPYRSILIRMVVRRFLKSIRSTNSIRMNNRHHPFYSSRLMQTPPSKRGFAFWSPALLCQQSAPCKLAFCKS